MRGMGDDEAVVCFDSSQVLRLPMRLATALRTLAIENGMTSEAALAYATLEWCASRLRTTSDREFGALAWTGAGLPARVLEEPLGDWRIEDVSVEYDTEWSAEMEMKEISIDESLDRQLKVSVGLTMDCSMTALREASQRGIRNPVETMGDVVTRERRRLLGLLEATQSVKGEETKDAARTLEWQRILMDAQVPIFGEEIAVPMMLTHDRAVPIGGGAGCKQSRKTRSSVPSVPMLIWDARERASRMTTQDVKVGVCDVGLLTRRQVIPFAAWRAGASALWDGGVSHPEWEATSADSRFSLHTPAFASESAVDEKAFKLNAENIERILRWHPQGAWIADGVKYGFGVMGDGAVRYQECAPSKAISTQEAMQVTEWMGKQVERGRTIPITDAEARSLVGLFVSPVAVAPKPGSDQIRTCHNMTAGGENSVNSGINFDPLNPIGLLQLDSVVACLRFMRLAHPEKKIKIAKCDLKANHSVSDFSKTR